MMVPLEECDEHGALEAQLLDCPNEEVARMSPSLFSKTVVSSQEWDENELWRPQLCTGRTKETHKCIQKVCELCFHVSECLLDRNRDVWSLCKPTSNSRCLTSNLCRAVTGASRCTHETVNSDGFARGVSQQLEFGCRLQGAFSLSSRRSMNPSDGFARGVSQKTSLEP